ncbi:MAG: IS66 family transposase zinc-finger binding domain-containing protein [Kofleriaceae bacterium]|nr:IS66 family transposase zinc-finger binding domain-containing protein [Kofleriaceae bacterium]
MPAAERACPTCGGERAVCIGHDITETIEFIPAKVVVREDRREKLACAACDGELARARRGQGGRRRQVRARPRRAAPR